MHEEDEVETRRNRLVKTIEQGSKVEYLFNQDEFKFFIGWVDQIREVLKNQILNGDLLDDKKEWHAKGGYTYLTKVVEGAGLFAHKAKKARNQLKKLEEDLKSANE